MIALHSLFKATTLKKRSPMKVNCCLRPGGLTPCHFNGHRKAWVRGDGLGGKASKASFCVCTSFDQTDR